MGAKSTVKKKLQTKTNKDASKNLTQINSNRKWYIAALVIIIFTLIIFFPTINHEFTNWDDDKLVLENEYVVNYTQLGFWNTLKAIDKHDPLTVLSHAFTYSIWHDNPRPYHIINLLLHLCNILLVFLLIKKLSNNQIIITIIATSLFAIHPFRAESVAWVAERKDLLYSFFFLIGLLFYLYYFKTRKIIFYFVSLLCLICSHLSKFAAITFPFVLLLIDYFLEHKITLKKLIEKIPFFVISILFVLAYLLQVGVEAPGGTLVGDFKFYERFILGCYALLFYFIQFFVPFFLSPMHPYPIKINDFLPVIYYLAAVVCLVLLIFIPIYYKKFKNINKDYLFGIGFFLINISLVLHIIPIGGNIVVGERYTYMAHIGLSFVAATFLYTWVNKKFPNTKTFFYFAAIAGLLIFSYLTRQQIMAWENNFTLYSAVIKKYPNSELAYYNRGLAHFKREELDESFSDFSKSIAINPNYPNVFNNRANVFYKWGKYREAINDCNFAIKIDSLFPDPYNTRALAYMQIKEKDSVFSDLEKAVKLQPTFAEAYNNLGIAYASYKNDQPAAIRCFKKAISINQKYAEAHCNLGISYNNTDSLQLALNAFSTAIQKNRTFANAYLNRGVTYQKMNNMPLACEDWKKALELKQLAAETYLKQYCR